jgi:hypothetical protein
VNTRTPEERVVTDAYIQMDRVGLQAYNTRVIDAG